MTRNCRSIYQMAVRSLTPQGTIQAAAELLPYIAELGFEYVYVIPLCEADRDMDMRTWSWQDINNPACPYKLVDFFRVDPEYGDDNDFLAFVMKAHSCGLKVMLDLVYLHCGRNIHHLKEDPDFLVRDENGEIPVGEMWPFARINFQSEKTREYLWSNMLYFVKDCGVDGFRCDCGDMVPLDFWEKGIRRVRKVNSDVLMLNEGYNHDTLNHGFDLLYTDNTRITGPSSLYMIKGEITVKEWKEKLAEPFSQEGRFIRFVENHDTASVAGLKRLEMLIGSDRMEAFIALTYTLNGVPFLWNGNEICDDSMTKTMGNRYFPGTNAINWAYAMTEKGRRRLKIVKTFNDLRKRHPELQASGVSLYPSPENMICYKRKLEGGEIKVFINLGDEEFRMAENGVDEIIAMNRTELEEHQIVIGKNGYMVTESKT